MNKCIMRFESAAERNVKSRPLKAPRSAALLADEPFLSLLTGVEDKKEKKGS